MAWYAHLTKAFGVIGLLTVTIPEIMKDGKITVQEIADLTIELSKIAGMNPNITVPEHIKNEVLGVTQ